MIHSSKNRTLLLIVLLSISVIMTGCTGNQAKATSEQASNSNPNKIQVISTLFPQYDFTKAIGGENVDVRLLMPPGTESHSYEPTPKDLVDIQNADVFIYTSLAMEPWVEKLLTQIGPNTLVVEATKGVLHLDAHEMGLEVVSDDHGHEGVDPHVWLDPANASIMAGNVAEGLMQVSPSEKEMFKKNLETYQTSLKSLDSMIATSLAKFPKKDIIFAGHNAFGYFAKKYEIGFHSPYAGFSPDSEPAPQKIAEMVDLMKSSGQKAVYYEELIDPKIARIIASETNAQMIMLHAAHNVSKDDLKNNLTYIEIMKENLTKLEEGLGLK